MKKTISILAIAAVVMCSIASCSKCTTCKKSGGSTTRLCEKDYNSNTEYGLAIDVLKGSGYDCN